jgi:outer membrane protein
MKARNTRGNFLPALKCLLALSAGSLTYMPTAQAAVDSPWLVRAGISQVEPKSNNGSLGGGVAVDRQIGPSLNVAYFFSPNIAVDVLGALPFEHDISIGGVHAGSTKHVPPTVTLQYHFLPDAAVQPFVGVGANYTFFTDEKLGGVKLKDSFGAAAQIGIDVPINQQWRVGFDARYIVIDTTAKLGGVDIGDVHIDPMVYSLNMGYRF